MVKKDSLIKLMNKLRGLEWCFMTGFAVEIYTNGKRKAGDDVDILVSPKDIKILAKRLNAEIEHRYFKKENFYVNDFGFQTSLGDLRVEVSSGFPRKRVSDGSINKIFQRRTLKKYQGINLWVEPIEELIVHKAVMFREKDVKDLRLLSKKKIDIRFLKEIATDYGKYWYTKAIKNLKSLAIL